LAALRRNLLEGARRRGDASLWLLRETDWRLFITVFVEVHRAGHYLWPEQAGDGTLACSGDLFDVYRAVDDQVGRILAEIDLDRTTLVVFSLHGMGPNRAQSHLVPAVLDRINASFMESPWPGACAARSQRSLMRRLRESVPSEIQEFVGRHSSDAVRDWVVSRALAGGFDWSQTPGFALPTGGEGLIRFNLAGRERDGLLPEGSELHNRYLDHLTREFAALRVVESGEPLLKDVVFPSAVFPGRHSGLLPDVSLRWSGEPPANEVHSPSLGTIRREFDSGRGGNHREGAFAIIAGRRAGVARAPCEITDFATLVPALL
jgi:predicted AlkP superfamily phosphohydrolase/phosphomutase